jgi:hypothetical protein
MGHVLKEAPEECLRLGRRTLCLAKKLFEQPLLEETGILCEQTKKDLIDEVGDGLRRVTASSEPAGEISSRSGSSNSSNRIGMVVLTKSFQLV